MLDSKTIAELLESFLCLLNHCTPQSCDGPTKNDEGLLRRSTLLSQSLSHIAARNMQAFSELIMHVSVHDLDATRETLIRLSSLHSWVFAKELSREGWCQLAESYTKLRSLSKAADVKAIATSNLAELLEVFNWIGPQTLTPLTHEDHSQLVNWEPSKIAQSPALSDAELRLRGSILAVWCSEQNAWPDKLQRRVKIWVHMLKHAVHERSVSIPD